MTKKGNVFPIRALNDALTLSFTGRREMCSSSGSTRSVGCQQHPEPEKGQRPPGYCEFLLWAAQELLPVVISEIVTKHLPFFSWEKTDLWHLSCTTPMLENSSSFVPHFSEMKESWKMNSSSSCFEGERSEVSIFRICCILQSSDTQDIPSSFLIK